MPNHKDWPVWFHIAILCVLLFSMIAFYVLLSIQGRYIIKRYEQETSLSKTRYFQNSAVAFIMSNWRSNKIGQYSLHLFLVWEMPQSLFKRLKALSDLPDKNAVLKHFSRSELALSIMFGFLMQFLVALMGFGLFERWYFSDWRP